MVLECHHCFLSHTFTLLQNAFCWQPWYKKRSNLKRLQSAREIFLYETFSRSREQHFEDAIYQRCSVGMLQIIDNSLLLFFSSMTTKFTMISQNSPIVWWIKSRGWEWIYSSEKSNDMTYFEGWIKSGKGDKAAIVWLTVSITMSVTRVPTPHTVIELLIAGQLLITPESCLITIGITS